MLLGVSSRMEHSYPADHLYLHQGMLLDPGERVDAHRHIALALSCYLGGIGNILQILDCGSRGVARRFPAQTAHSFSSIVQPRSQHNPTTPSHPMHKANGITLVFSSLNTQGTSPFLTFVPLMCSEGQA
jgi:hypothetical protein